jgi:hypothetical protein
MEQMILPRLSGPHVPACFAAGDFARQPYVVIERIPGKTLYSRLGELPLILGRRRPSPERLPPHLPICTGKMSSITTSSRAASCFARAARRS